MIKKNLLLLCLLLICSKQVLSQDSTNSSKINLSKLSFLKKALPSSISFFGIYSGPSLNGAGDPVDQDGDVSEGSINTWTQVSLRWELGNGYRFLVNPRFRLNHNNIRDDRSLFQLRDPVFGFNKRWKLTEKLSASAALTTILPFARTEATRDNKLLFNPGGFNNINYQVTNALSLSTGIWTRAYFYGRRTEEDDTRYAFSFYPTIAYSFSDRSNLSLFFTINGDAQQNFDPNIGEGRDDSISLAYAYTISKHLTIQPILTTYRNNDYSIGSANIGAWFFGKLF